MRICLSCAAEQDAYRWTCPACGSEPPTVDGFRAFAPALAHLGTGFRPSYFAELAALEEANFWFRARNQLIIWALATYFPKAERIMEVGCGTGFVLHAIHNQSPSTALIGSELLVAGLEFAAARVPAATFYQMDATVIPYRDEFDVIGAFDVLEHVQDDASALEQLRQAIAPGGGLLMTVPQHPALWSEQDVLAEHVRRYTAHGMRRRLSAAGLELVHMTSFTSLLLPLLVASRWTKRSRKDVSNIDVMSELRQPRPINALLEAVMRIEGGLLRRGWSLPAGGSLLVVARRPPSSEAVHDPVQ
jgi:SAM-dependent methyltransferase